MNSNHSFDKVTQSDAVNAENQLDTTSQALEIARLAALYNLQLLDTPADEIFNRLTRLTATALNVPAAFFGLVDLERIWFKSQIGLKITELERSAFLNRCIQDAVQGQPVFIADLASEKNRAILKSLNLGSTDFRFLAAYPIYSLDNHLIGILAILDYKSRQLTGTLQQSLQDASYLYEQEIAKREHLRSLPLSKSSPPSLQLNEQIIETLDNISDAFYILNNQDIFVHVNKTAEAIIQMSRETIIGRNAWEVFEPAKETTFYTNYYAAWHTQKPVQFENYYAPFNKWVETRLHPSPQYMGVYIRDITERKMIEQERLQMDKLEGLSVLAGGIAHDFNNLLTTVMSNLSLLRMAQTHTSEEVWAKIEHMHDYISQAEKACLRARDITRQLLTLSKGDQPVLKPTKLNNLVEEAINFALHGSNVDCIFTSEKNLWQAEVDGGQISQVLQNLVINAIHAMNKEQGQDCSEKKMRVSLRNITIETALPANSTTSNEADYQSTVFYTNAKGDLPLPMATGRYVLIEVKDSGAGIPEEILPKIFDAYFTTKKDGTGIGLAICQSIIRKHEGFIFVKSTVGMGTTFYIYLPAKISLAEISNFLTETEATRNQTGPLKASEEKTPVQKLARRPLSLRNTPAEKFEGKVKGRILMMDDDRQLIEAVSELLGYMGYEVRTCYNGEELLEIYQREGSNFDIVMLDLTIKGGMGGLEAVGKLRELDPQVKAVAASGYSDSELLKDYKSYGFNGVIKKPYTAAELGQEIDLLLNRK